MQHDSRQENQSSSQPEVDIRSSEPVSGQEFSDVPPVESEPVATAEAQLAEERDRYRRLYAEFDNYKKRVDRDRKDLTRFASQELLLAFLPVVDDFDRALKAMSDMQGPAAEGVLLIHQKLNAILESKGVKPMDATGKVFDTNFHEAIAQIPATSEEAKGNVIEEVVKGYFLHDKVLRYAKVVVGV